MKIDNSIRRHWGFLPKNRDSEEGDKTSSENDTYGISDTVSNIGTRFRVTAQEWLPTWRSLE